MDDLISRRAAIDAIKNADVCMAWNGEISAEDAADIAVRATKRSVVDSIEDLPSVQPDLTLESAIDYLYSIGWMESHDKQMYEDGQRHVQPEIIRCRDCKYWREHKYAKETKRYVPFCGFNAIYTKEDDFCSRAERRTDE